MPAIEVKGITKTYDGKVAVHDLSFSVEHGEIFGLIGPNGAGKTSTIRMIMDILQPDAGEILVFGQRTSAGTKARIGFLPEERGLYRKLSVMDSMLYLASLKGMRGKEAEKRAEELLARVGMAEHKQKRVEALSKGMSQIIQFLVTIIHDPDLVILDEPFTGLDPVNTELVKTMFQGLREEGKAIILSTHQMNDVEELCDRILMIDHGRAILYGDLAEIKESYSDNSVLLDVDGELGADLEGVTRRRSSDGRVELLLDDRTKPQQILEQIVARRVSVRRFEAVVPPLREIFLQVVGERRPAP